MTQRDGQPLGGVIVAVQGTGLAAATTPNGRYSLSRVPQGEQVIQFRLLGYAPHEVTVHVAVATATTADAVLEARPIELGTIVVEGASRAPDRMIDAPAAVDVVPRAAAQAAAITAQPPLALERIPGLDLPQSGVNDFNVNARGFNVSLDRSMLVLQDGRDLSDGLVGSQEWAALSQPIDDAERIEVVRGPGSALYGANAVGGVISITTPPARDVVGTKLTLGGGELTTVRADLRQAGVASDARIGYRLNLGYNRSNDWSRSRTRFDTSDFKQEYALAASGTFKALPPELTPLNGQTKDPVTGQALGDPLPLVSAYGSARLDYYAAKRSMVTLDGGASQTENSVFVTSTGRVQYPEVLRPWARLAWEADAYDVSAWYSGRSSQEPEVLLNSGHQFEDDESVFHVEGRYNRSWLHGLARVVIGTSAQDSRVNTHGTLMELNPEQDDRSDKSYAGYTQLEYAPLRKLRLLGALRWDAGDLFAARLSPKGALVFAPSRDQALRLTVNRAFLTPSLTQLFLTLQNGVRNLAGAEAKVRAALPAALAGVPPGQLFDPRSASVPFWAFGDSSLVPETMTSYELGYKGQLGVRAFVSVDVFDARVKDFVTKFLPCCAARLNPAFSPWTAPSTVPGAYQSAVDSVARSAAGPALTRLADGTTALVVSSGNAGVVDDWGVEVGTSLLLTDALSLGGSYTFFGFEVRQQQLGDVLLPNTPKHKGTVSVSYSGRHGIDLAVDIRLLAGYQWAVGVDSGYVPASQTVNLDAGYRINRSLRVHATGTDIFNQERFQIYGGSVIGRRVLVGVTSTL